MSTVMSIMNDDKYNNLDDETKAKLTIAVSMKMVNRVYESLMQYLAHMVVHEEGDEKILEAFAERSEDYQSGWNSAIATMMQLITSFKYSRDDVDDYAKNYLEMLRDEELSNQEPGGDIPLP